MGMVYCRGCAKKIHETAPTCPHCGAPQGLQGGAEGSRNTLVLVIVGLGWSLVFWFLFLFIGGMIVGTTHPDGASEAGREFGRALGVPLLLLSFALSGMLTTLGKLPGTNRK